MTERRFSVLDAIGDTPLVQVDNVYAKLESVNPSGSIKDRVALEMINQAERDGSLKPGYTVVEATDGVAKDKDDRVVLKKTGPVIISFSNGDSLVVEKGGRRLTMGTSGIGKRILK